MEEKKVYETSEIEIIEFDSEDIITSSDNTLPKEPITENSRIPSILQRNIEKQNSRGTKPWEFSNLLYRLVQTNSDLLAIIRQRVRPGQ